MKLARALVMMLCSRLSRLRTELQVRARFPRVSLAAGSSFLVDDWTAVEIGRDVHIGGWSEIVVLQESGQSSIKGRLTVGACTVIGAWANIRAAGGKVEIGTNVLIGQHVSILAANHMRNELGLDPRESCWDETRTGVRVGDGAWIGADVVILPGVTIGPRAILAAGSVATRDVPTDEVWGGVPARSLSRTGRSV